jgi:hypothetical protein
VDALRDLSDAPASAKETEQLTMTCLGVSGVMSVESLKARKSGPYLYVEATVDVDGSISASAAHRYVLAADPADSRGYVVWGTAVLCTHDSLNTDVLPRWSVLARPNLPCTAYTTQDRGAYEAGAAAAALSARGQRGGGRESHGLLWPGRELSAVGA